LSIDRGVRLIELSGCCGDFDLGWCLPLSGGVCGVVVVESIACVVGTRAAVVDGRIDLSLFLVLVESGVFVEKLL
jgi:hypothetical protein